MVLLIPGLATTTNIFGPIKETLNKWHIKYYELNYNTTTSSIELSFIKALDKFLEKHDPTDTTVISWSLGSNLMLEAVNKTNILFKKYILVSSGLDIYHHSNVVQQLKKALDSNNNITNTVKEFLSNAINKKLDLNSQKKWIQLLQSSTTTEMQNKAYLSNAIAHLQNYKLENIPKGNFAMINGLEDKIVPLKSAEKLRNILKEKNNIVNFYGITCGHIPFIEEYDTFNEILEHELF